jgi:alanine dehydrogenase
VLKLADAGWQAALREDAGLREGLNLHAGSATHPAVAALFDLPYVAPASL